MIKDIIDRLNAKVDTLNYFSRKTDLCELIIEGEGDRQIEQPAEYLGMGEYESISDPDLQDGIIYWRLTGEVTQDRDEGEGLPQNHDFYIRSYPLQCVFTVSRDKLTNDAYADHRVVENVINATWGKDNTLKSTLNASRVDIDISSYSTDRIEILSGEYQGVEVDTSYNMAYGRIIYNVEVLGSDKCFTQNTC